jgi:hypothetical protein
MNTPPISNDSDTDRLLNNVAWNLKRFFGYVDAAAIELVRSAYPKRDDDFYYHEGAFRSAAFMHYSATHGGSISFEDFGVWFRAHDFADEERKALENYRETYFQKG